MLDTPSISALTRVHSPPQGVTPLFAGYARAATPLTTRSARKSPGEANGARRTGRPPTRALAWLCVPGLAREHAEIDADLLQRLLVFAAGVLTENQLGIGRAMQPA